MDDTASQAWLRPETAQGMFVDFTSVVNSSRPKIPFGIAQIGKSFRNEITTGNFIFRLRELEIMEMEWFCKPGDDDEWFTYWCDEWVSWFRDDLGLRQDHLRLRAHEKAQLAHYSKGTSDVEYLFPFGWGELGGIAMRTDYDLKQHEQYSGKDLSFLDTSTNEKFAPYVVEPTTGVDRSMIGILVDAYDEEEVRGETRVVLHIHPSVSPFEVAVLPLSKKAELSEPAHNIEKDLRKTFRVEYDETQSIGRRYRRQDEIGTPLAITFDFDSLEDHAVTIRNRDSMEQVRVPVEGLTEAVRDQLSLASSSAVQRANA
jgi:glycyl-tRNA synthetase